MGWLADLLKEIPSAAKYKAGLEEMETENVALKQKVSALESEVENLRKEIQRRDNVVENNTPHSERLREDEERVMMAIATLSLPHLDEIIDSVSLPRRVVLMHLLDLTELGYIKASCGYEEIEYFSLLQNGRRYLYGRGILQSL